MRITLHAWPPTWQCPCGRCRRMATRPRLESAVSQGPFPFGLGQAGHLAPAMRGQAAARWRGLPARNGPDPDQTTAGCMPGKVNQITGFVDRAHCQCLLPLQL